MTPRASQVRVDTGPGEGFAREERLRRRPDFVVVQEQGRRHSGRNFLLLSLARPQAAPHGPARLGITVSKKVGNAVVRNRVKRWVRESYRRTKSCAPVGVDLVVIARPSAAGLGFAGTADELGGLLRRLKAR